MRDARPPMADDAAFALLVACADWPATARRNSAIAAAATALAGEWSEFRELAERHHLVIPVVRSLGEAGLTPPARLIELARRQQQRALKLAGEALRIIDTLERENIAAAVLKGPLLSRQLYGDPAMRQCVDVDILVNWSDFRHALNVLRGQGYVLHGHEPPWDDWRIERWQRLAKDVTLMHPQAGVSVELHHRLKSPESLLPGLGLAQMSRTISLAGRDLRAFESRDLFVYLCVHAATSFWDRLKWLADLRALLAGVEVAEIGAWQRHSQDLGTDRCTALGLMLCHHVWDQPIPPEIVQSPQDARWLDDLVKASLQRLRAPPRHYTSLANSLDRRRLRELRSDAVYRRAQASELIYDHELLATIRLPRALRALYLPLRIWLFVRRKLGFAKDPRLSVRN